MFDFMWALWVIGWWFTCGMALSKSQNQPGCESGFAELLGLWFVFILIWPFFLGMQVSHLLYALVYKR